MHLRGFKNVILNSGESLDFNSNNFDFMKEFFKIILTSPLHRIIFDILVLMIFSTIVVNILTEAVKRTFFSDSNNRDLLQNNLNNKIDVETIIIKITHFFICFLSSTSLIIITFLNTYDLFTLLLYIGFVTLITWGSSFLFYHLFFKWLFLIGDLISLYIKKQRSILNFEISLEKIKYYKNIDYINKNFDKEDYFNNFFTNNDEEIEENDKGDNLNSKCKNIKNITEVENYNDEELLGVGSIMPVNYDLPQNKTVILPSTSLQNNNESFLIKIINFIKKHKFLLFGILVTIGLILIFGPMVGGLSGIVTLVGGVLEKIFKKNKNEIRIRKDQEFTRATQTYNSNIDSINAQINNSNTNINNIKQEHQTNENNFQNNLDKINNTTTVSSTTEAINTIVNILNK